MLGYRFWDFTLDESKNPMLTSVTASYKWKHNVVGEEIKYIAQVDQRKIAYFDQDINEWVEWEDKIDVDEECRVPEMGFFSFLELESASYESYYDGIPMVVGAVNGFGKIAVHSDGWRAEYCQILGILDYIPCLRHPEEKGNIHMFDGYNLNLCNDSSHKVSDFLIKPKVSFQHDYFLKQLSLRYDVELMTYDQLLRLGG